jgi:hypothetical protein
VYLSEERGSLVVIGRSRYGCPVLEISRLWEALHDNAILFGIVMVAVGVMELLFGRKMLQPTIFVAAYCLTFAIVGAFVSEIILGPDSSLLVIYFSLLGVLFISSFVAYLVMGISPLSIFCIGACTLPFYLRDGPNRGRPGQQHLHKNLQHLLDMVLGRLRNLLLPASGPAQLPHVQLNRHNVDLPNWRLPNHPPDQLDIRWVSERVYAGEDDTGR